MNEAFVTLDSQSTIIPSEDSADGKESLLFGEDETQQMINTQKNLPNNRSPHQSRFSSQINPNFGTMNTDCSLIMNTLTTVSTEKPSATCVTKNADQLKNTPIPSITEPQLPPPPPKARPVSSITITKIVKSPQQPPQQQQDKAEVQVQENKQEIKCTNGLDVIEVVDESMDDDSIEAEWVDEKRGADEAKGESKKQTTNGHLIIPDTKLNTQLEESQSNENILFHNPIQVIIKFLRDGNFRLKILVLERERSTFQI